MRADELKERTQQFAIGVLKLVQALPATLPGKTVARPLVRCGTMVGSTYRAACRSRSRFEFMERIGTVEEMTEETCYWFEVILAAGLLKPEQVQPWLDEGRALQAIFVKSRKSAVQRYRQHARRSRDSDDEDIPF